MNLKLNKLPKFQITLIRIWRLLSLKRKLQFILVFILTIFAAIAEVISLSAVIPFLTSITSANGNSAGAIFFERLLGLAGWNINENIILFFTVLFGVTALIAGALRLLLLWAQTRLSFSTGADFSVWIYEKTLHQPYALHISRNSNEVISGVTSKANCIVMNAIYPMLTIASSVVIMLGILGVLFKISPIIALGSCLGFGLIYFLIIIVTRKQLLNDSLKISMESTETLKALSQGLGGIRDVLIDGTQPYFIQTYKKSELALRRALANTQLISSSPRFIVESFGMLLVAILAYFLTNSSNLTGDAVPVLGALALGAQRLLPLLQQIYANWSAIRAGQHSVMDALNLLDQKMPTSFTAKLEDELTFSKSIRFQNASFKYQNSSQWVIKDLDIEFSKGGFIGIIGTTGSGKTTLADLIMALLHPEIGDLLVDGKKITELNQRLWQSRISHVPQNIFLSDTTVMENIAFGIPMTEIDMARVVNAAKMAQIHDVITSFDYGYQARVGERGIQLSGGQRQRLGIARAFYKGSDVIVFDEATSALDGETENQIMTEIYNLDRNLTVFVVAHRHSTLSGCTDIIRVDGGLVNRVSKPEMENIFNKV